MNPEKIVVMTPLLAPPNPRDFDDLIPQAAREVMAALERQYSDIIASCGNNDNNSYDHILTSNLRLSPIPCLENSDQWSDLQITIDTGSRRNQKLIDKSNRNLDLVLGKVRDNISDLNLNKTSNNNDNSKKDKSTFIKEKLDLKQFEFTEKKKKVKSKDSNNEINKQISDAVREIEETVVTKNNDETEVRTTDNAKSNKVTSRKNILEQFAFKPRSKNADALDGSSKSNDLAFENQVIINKSVQSDNRQVNCAENSEITFNYVPSDDSSNMSFSQKSAELNFMRKTHVIIDETPEAKQVSAVELLAQKYNKCGNKKVDHVQPNHIGIMHSNNQIIIEETPQNQEKSALELLAQKYCESENKITNNAQPNHIGNMHRNQIIIEETPRNQEKSALELLAQKYNESGKHFDNSMQQDVQNNGKEEQIIVDETPQIKKSDLELLVQKSNENRYVYGDYTLTIENPDRYTKKIVEQNINKNEPNIIIDETPMYQELSTLERFAQKYNSSSIQFNTVNSCTKQINMEEDNRSKNTKEKVAINDNGQSEKNKVNLATDNSNKNIKEKLAINDNMQGENELNLTKGRIINEYVPSDDSSNMSFSPKSPSHNIVVEETQNQNQVSALETLTRKYNENRNVKFDISEHNQKTQQQNQGLEFLTRKYNENRNGKCDISQNAKIQGNPEIIDTCQGNADKILQNINKQNIENQNLFVLENKRNINEDIIDETPQCKQISALELLALKYNDSGSIKLTQNSQNHNTKIDTNKQQISDENAPCKQVSDLELKSRKSSKDAGENIVEKQNGVSNSVKQINNSDELNIIDETPQGKNISTLDLLVKKYNVNESMKLGNFAQNAEIQNLINIKRSIKENVKDTVLCKKPKYDTNMTHIKEFQHKKVSGINEQNKHFKNDNSEQNIIDETPQKKHCILDVLARKYSKTNYTKIDNLPSGKVEILYTGDNQNNVKISQAVREKCEEDIDDLFDKSVSQNKVRTFNKDTKQSDANMEDKNENMIVDEQNLEDKTQDCLNQSITQNKIDYIENWIMNLPDQNFKDTSLDHYDEHMDIDIPVDKENSLRKIDEKLQEENSENTNSEVTRNYLKSKALNPCASKENIQHNIDLENVNPKGNNEAPRVLPNDSTQKQSINLTESGTQYVEDWFKDMPEEYSKIKNLFDFDMPTSKDTKPQNLPTQTDVFQIKPKPFLPPKPVGKPHKTKIIQRKTYMLEIDKSKPVPQPKRVQTKITSIFQPINVDIPKQPEENTESNAKEVEHKIVDTVCTDTKSRKRKMSDHFKVVRPKAKNAKLEDQEEELKQDNQGPKFVKKKYKFFTPILSQLPEKEVKYEMYTVDDNMAKQMESYIKENVPHEICFNIIYRDGFCQLSQPKKTGNFMYNPNGLMLNISWLTEKLTKSYFTEFYHIHLSKTHWKDFSIPRSLIKTCLTMNCRKISFKAQTLFVLLMDAFSFTAEEVSLEWIVLDPFIGCWVLDPDHPPTTFQGVQSQLDARPNYKVTATDVLIKSCDMLIQLSETTQKLQSRLEERDLWTIFMEMEMKIVSILAVMEHRGISTNVNVLKSFSKTLKEKSETVEKSAYKIAGRKFQLISPAQVRSLLYDDLKLDTTNCIEIKQTATLGAKSTSEPMLQLLRKVHPLPGLVLEYRHLHKAKSTFVDAMLQHVKNGIIKSTWEQTAAATGRIASSNPNLQAIPKHPFSLILFPENGDTSGEDILRLRNAYSARPGYTLLAADFQHIELRVFAHLARDQTITDALNSSGDIFMKMTKSWLGNKVDVITEEHREQTKKIVYATIYGAGPGKLADILCVPQEEAITILRDFTNKFPSLREFSTTTIEQCRIQGYLTSLSGRCRLFPNINSTVFGLKAQSERQAVNFLIQGSAADICKAAMISTEQKLKRFNCKLLLQIHDELVWEVADSELDQVKSIVKQVMEDTSTMCGKLIKLSVPLPVSITIGKNWGDMK